MAEIVSRPYTPEGEETWERVFGKKEEFLDSEKDINIKFTIDNIGHVTVKEIYQP